MARLGVVIWGSRRAWGSVSAPKTGVPERDPAHFSARSGPSAAQQELLHACSNPSAVPNLYGPVGIGRSVDL